MIATAAAPSAPARSEAFAGPGSALPNPILSARLSRPSHPALESSGLTWKTSDLSDGVARFAGRLAGFGVVPGMRVGLVGPASPEWVLAFHALGWLGASVAPFDPQATPAEARRAMEAVEPERVIATHGLDHQARERWREAAPGLRFLTNLPLAPPPPERFWPLDEERVCVLTSGSSGAARPVSLTTSQLAFSAFGSAIRLGHDPADRWLACLPFHHVGGLSILLRCAFYGTSVILEQRFDPSAIARHLDSGRISLVSLVPTMLERVLDAREERPFPSALRAILLGGDAAPRRLLDRCRELGAPVALTWGMTEAASQLATRAPGDLPHADDSELPHCGAPLPFCRIRSEGGVLTARGPLCLDGGPLVTRDRGRIDSLGRVQIEGRAESFCVSGGETISLVEIEHELSEHPAVAEVGVVAIPDQRWGERPVAVLVACPQPAQPKTSAGDASSTDTPSDASLRAWCAERLSRAKLPLGYVWVASLPRTELGKLARGALRALALEALGEREPEAVNRLKVFTPPPPSLALPQGHAILEHLIQTAKERVLPHTHPGDLGPGGEGLSGLAEARDWLNDDLGRLDASLAALQKEPATASWQAARHLLDRPGKRLRPLCALLAARLGGRPLDHAVRNVAIAVELVHTATLLHDDVIDEGTVRRDAPASRVVFGNSASVLGGDYLFAEALGLVGATGREGLLSGLLRVIADMVEAEALQLERRGRIDLSRETYLRVIRGKTAALFEWAFWAGGILSGLSVEEAAALARAGDALGMAFQLADDLLDLADSDETGKDTLADLRQGKVTFPFIVASERDPRLPLLLRAMVDLEPGPELAAAAAEVADVVRASGALNATRAFADEEAERALAALRELPGGWARSLLEAAVEAAARRGR